MMERDSNAAAAAWVLGGLLIAAGALVLVAIVAFVWIAVGFRASFTSSWPPVEDMVLGYGTLAVVAFGGVALIGWGWRLLRRA